METKNKVVGYAEYFVSALNNKDWPYHSTKGLNLILTYREWKKYKFYGIDNSNDYGV